MAKKSDFSWSHSHTVAISGKLGETKCGLLTAI